MLPLGIALIVFGAILGLSAIFQQLDTSQFELYGKGLGSSNLTIIGILKAPQSKHNFLVVKLFVYLGISADIFGNISSIYLISKG